MPIVWLDRSVGARRACAGVRNVTEGPRLASNTITATLIGSRVARYGEGLLGNNEAGDESDENLFGVKSHDVPSYSNVFLFLGSQKTVERSLQPDAENAHDPKQRERSAFLLAYDGARSTSINRAQA